MARHWGEMKRFDIEMSGHNLYNMVHKLRLIFSKPDIEIPGRSEKKWTDRRFFKYHFVLQRNKE